MMDDQKQISEVLGSDMDFFKQVAEFIATSRKYAKKQLDQTITITHYMLGWMIVEREQQGEKRAKYGAKLINGLSEYLTELYGRGYSVANLKSMRKFYIVYSPQIQQPLIAESEKGQTLSALFVSSELWEHIFGGGFQKGQTLSAQFKLSWSHYQCLMRINSEDARRFYEIEAENQHWASRQLQRQIGSSLYERLALSRDKDRIMSLANKGQTIENPRDIFKSPYVLEFTGLEEHPEYNESDLETALIDHLQDFLLELGKGFLFEARQKRFTFDEKSFYVDLVLYNRLLQCYVLIDIKVDEMKHQDLGQLMMYVNYFDRFVRQEFEKPTIGILLCSQKYDNIVKLTLPEDSNIYASEYNLYLPDKALLQRKLAEWIAEFKEEQEAEGDFEETSGVDGEEEIVVAVVACK
jgi:predicted nuclease of restriction endonuclease-like (RecB) superfamily